jgi:hypothetical protein
MILRAGLGKGQRGNFSMSMLIDDIVFENTNGQILKELRCSGENPRARKTFWIAKPVNFWSFRRAIDAFRVLLGKSVAVHYKEDEIG